MKLSKAIEVLQQLHTAAGDSADVVLFRDANKPMKPVTGMRIEHDYNGEPMVLVHVLDLTVNSEGFGEPSKEFEDAFCDSGGFHVRCDGCGRDFFNYMEGGSFKKGELSRLGRLAEDEPSRVVAVDHTIGFIYLMGYKFVVGCPCNRIRIAEEFLLDNQHEVKQYFLARAERLRKEAAVAEAIGNAGDDS